MKCCNPVIPLLLCPVIPSTRAVVSDPEQIDEAEVVVDLSKEAVLGEPIVGVEVVTLDSQGQGALPARALPSPKEPTQAERDRHNLTHLPFCLWCPICIACRRPNNHHRLLQDHSREVPLLAGDYGFIRNAGDESLVCVLVL